MCVYLSSVYLLIYLYIYIWIYNFRHAFNHYIAIKLNERKCMCGTQVFTGIIPLAFIKRLLSE